MTSTRNLVLVLGGELDRRGSAFEGFDPDADAIWMAETEEEATHVWCHKLRLAFFFRNYIHRMSSDCGTCRYRHDEATGEDACPFTTLYWDFLDRHYERFRDNRRMTFQVKNLERKAPAELEGIRAKATELRKRMDAGGRV